MVHRVPMGPNSLRPLEKDGFDMKWLIRRSLPGTVPAASRPRGLHGLRGLLLAAFALSAPLAAAQPGPSSPPSSVAPAARFELEGPAAAPDAASKKRAAELEKQAREVAKREDCSAALPLYAEAYRLAGSESALELSVACYESRAEWVRAYELCDELLRVAPASKVRPAREAKLAEPGQKTAVLALSLPERHLEPTLDGERLRAPGEARLALRVLPGRHTVQASKPRFEPFSATFAVAAGASALVDVKLAPSPLPVTPSVDRGEVIDFCYLPSSTDTTRSHKQRLVLFKLAGRAVADLPEDELDEKGKVIAGRRHFVMRDAGMHDHIRSVFLSTVLMDRFYTVEASVESPQGVARKPFLTDDEMIGAAGPDGFTAYSLACTDWVAMPRLAGKKASWQKTKVTEMRGKQKVERWVWQLNVVWDVGADLYRRSPKGFELRATVHGTNGGLFGTAMALSALAPQKNGVTSALPALSKRPEPGCNPPLLPELAGLASSAVDCKGGRAGPGRMAEHVLDAAADTTAEATNGGELSGPERAGEHAAEHRAEDVVNGAGAEERKTLERADKELESVPGAKEAVSGSATELAGAALDSDAAHGVEAALSSEERAALTALAGADPAAVDRLLALEGTVKSAAVLKLIGRAKHAFDSCRQGVRDVQEASDKLRTLSQQGPQALGLQAVAGLASCAGIDLAPDLSTATAPGAEQRSSKFCQNVQRDVALGEAAMTSVAVCDGRVAMEHAALALQKDVKQQRELKLFATLLALPGVSPDRWGIALGSQEGVHRGDLYVAVTQGADGTAREGGFGRIQVEGTGAPDAVAHPSELELRSGTADAGTRVEEHAQVGVPLGVRPLVKYYTFRGQLKSTLAYGAAIEGGYNASRYVSVGNEVWGRACASFANGSDNELFFDLELGPEVVHYLGAGFAAYGGLGVDVAYAMKRLATTTAQKETLSGFNIGGLLTLGLDYAITPDWNARLSAAYRQGGGATKLENDSKTSSINASSLSDVQGGVAAGYTF